MPAFDGSDDFVGVCGPCERLWSLVCLGDEAVDGGLEIDDGSEDASLQSALGQFGEVPLHGVQPGACAHASMIPPTRGAVQANWPENLLLPCPKNATPLVLHGCARASEARRIIVH